MDCGSHYCPKNAIDENEMSDVDYNSECGIT